MNWDKDKTKISDFIGADVVIQTMEGDFFVGTFVSTPHEIEFNTKDDIWRVTLDDIDRFLILE